MAAAKSRSAIGAALVTVVLVAAACTGDDGGSTGTPTSAPARTSTTLAADDGILRIGVLVPDSGAGQALGRPLAEAVDLAVAEVNQAGGVNGVLVEVVHADEGDTVATASQGVAELLQAHVDAVIGPASSKVALAVLDSFVDEGVITCSPTAAASALSAFPDNRLFIRTIPHDALQGVAMAEMVERAGVSSAAIVAPDDSFGRDFTDAISGGLARRGVVVSAAVPYDATNDFGIVAAIEHALATEPGAIAIVGNSVAGRDMLATALGIVPPGVPVVVNDQLRTPGDVELPLVDGFEVAGTSPRAAPAPGSTGWFSTLLATFLGVDIAELPASFAAHAYDCVSLLTIAAEAAGSNSATNIVPRLVDVSQGGANCINFTSCQVLLEDGRNIDLNGASGPLELEADGDVSTGWFDRFRFDEDGTDVTDGDLLVGAF